MSGNMAMPLALLCVGYSLEFKYLDKNMPLVVGASAIKLIVMPVIAFLLGYYFFKLRGPDLGLSVLLPATPSRWPAM